MYLFNDFICVTVDCSEYNKTKDIMHEKDEVVVCQYCKNEMIKEMPGPRGKVLGSNTPVKQ